MNAKLSKKIILSLVAGVASIAIIAWCIGAAMFENSQTLFSVNPTEVVSIKVENTTMLTQVEISDSEQIKEIVDLVNGFTYSSSKKVPPSGGSGYYVLLKTESGGMGFEFWSSGVKKRDPEGEPGSHILYYGKTGYFDPLMELAENATDPIM